MRQVNINGQQVTIVGSAITPRIYESEFKTRDNPGDMPAEVGGYMNADEHGPSVLFSKWAWAMAKCAVFPREFPDYDSWIDEIGGFDYSDELLTQGVVFEAMKGCFPGKKALVSEAEAKLEAKRAGEQPVPGAAGVGEADEPVAD